MDQAQRHSALEAFKSRDIEVESPLLPSEFGIHTTAKDRFWPRLELFSSPRRPRGVQGPRHRGRHPGVELRANLKSISHRCHLFEMAFVWEVTKETIQLPLGCLQGGYTVLLSTVLDVSFEHVIDGRGAAKADDAQGTHTQSHISQIMIVHEKMLF